MAYPEKFDLGSLFFALIKDKKCGKISTAGIEIQSWSTLCILSYFHYIQSMYSIHSLQGVIILKYFLCNINEWAEFLEFLE